MSVCPFFTFDQFGSSTDWDRAIIYYANGDSICFRGSVTLTPNSQPRVSYRIPVTTICQQNREPRRQQSSPYLFLFNFHGLTDDIKKHGTFLFVIRKSDRGSNHTSTTRKVVTIMQAGFQGSRKNFFSVIYVEKIRSWKPKRLQFQTRYEKRQMRPFVNSLKSWRYTREMSRQQHV